MTTPKQIYQKFIEFEERAASFYVQLASHCSGNCELSAFWLDMGMQEKQHAGLLQFCLAENLFAGNLPDTETTQRVETLFSSVERRAANPDLGIHEAFELAMELEMSEVNDMFSLLTVCTHTSLYLWRRKVELLAPDHAEYLAEAARRFDVGDAVSGKPGLPRERCS